MRHFLRFNVVGTFGITVQMVTLALLVRSAGVDYLLATAIAVEASVLHNFVWHRNWTWADRLAESGVRTGVLLLRFHATAGAVSIAGNLVCMRLLVGGLGLNVLVANALTIAGCALLNFLLADRYAFAGATVCGEGG